MTKTKVFVSAYACEPGLGSEIGVGWHWVLEMSKYFELWVLTRKSNQSNIEEWMNAQDEKYDIHFLYYDLPDALRFWKRGLRGVRLYYTIWQSRTNKIVKNTMKENDIKIYHLLTYGNSLWKASRYGIKQFFVWGPTGGVDTIPAEYSKHYGFKSRMIEWARRSVVKMLPINIGFQKRCKNADLILCKSYNMQNAIPEKYRDKAILFTDVAVEMKQLKEEPSGYNWGEIDHTDVKIKYIVVGKLDAWRGFDVLVEAFAKAYDENKNIELEILGKGNDKERIQKLIEDKEMTETIQMSGEVSMDEYFEKVKKADVIVNTSLKEGAVTVSFDAMALAKPLICVDTGGYTRYFNNENAVVLERGHRDQLVDDIKDAILKLSDERARREIGRKTFESGQRYTWEQKGQDIYDAIMKAYEGR